MPIQPPERPAVLILNVRESRAQWAGADRSPRMRKDDSSAEAASVQRGPQNIIEQGFTLVELLIVIVILGILAGIVVFAVGNLTEQRQDQRLRDREVDDHHRRRGVQGAERLVHRHDAATSVGARGAVEDDAGDYTIDSDR